MSFSYQMPNYTDLMHRAIDLVKPGGWFLLEDCDHMLYDSTGTGQGTRTLFDVLNNDHFKANGCDPYLGPTLERRLKETNLFSKVNAVKINCPVSPGPISGEFVMYCPRLAYRFISLSLLSFTGILLLLWSIRSQIEGDGATYAEFVSESLPFDINQVPGAH
jgi:hypothetical protein